MSNKRKLKIAGAVAGVLLCLLSSSSHAQQVQTVAYGGAEADTQELTVYTVGVSFQRAARGWGPVGELRWQRIEYSVGAAGSVTNYGLSPSGGVRYRWQPGGVRLTVGYLWLSKETLQPSGFVRAEESTFTTAVQANYWGSGTQSAQLIANYHWSDGSLWARGRAGRRLVASGAQALSGGGELVLQGEPDGYRAIQVGPYAEVQLTQSLRTIGAAGYKADNQGDESGFVYFKVEFVWIPPAF